MSPGRIVLVGSLLVLAAVAWLAWSGWRLVDGLLTVRAQEPALSQAIRDQDWDAADRHVQGMSDGAQQAADAASALPLAAASVLPVVGDDVTALRVAARAADVASSEAAVPLLTALRELTAPGPDGTAVPLDRLQAAAPPASAAAAAASRAAADMEAVPVGRLFPAVREPFEKATAGVVELSDRTAIVDQALRVLPGALGAEGPREYLVAFQNLAEARPTGGIVGAWALIEMADGRPVLKDTGVNDDLETLRGPVRDLGPEASALYGQKLGPPQNVNLSPHFPQAALLLSDLWAAQRREVPDAVLALDPVGLATMLRPDATVEVPGGPALTGDNLVEVLLNDVYRIFDNRNRARAQYMSRVTGQVFQQTLDDGLLQGSTLRRVAKAAADGHVLAWSPDAAEQELFERVGVSGSLPPPDPDVVGAYVTNIDASKLDYYLDVEIRTLRPCGGSGPQVEVTLENEAPAEVPEYVGHHLDDGTDPTFHRVLLTFLLPPERGVARMAVDGQTSTLTSGTERGWTVVQTPVELSRGQTRTVSAELSGMTSVPLSVLTQPQRRQIDVTTDVACS